MPGASSDSTDLGVKMQNVSHRNLLSHLGLEPGAPESLKLWKQKTISTFQKRLSMGQGGCSLFQKAINHIKYYKNRFGAIKIYRCKIYTDIKGYVYIKSTYI